MQDVRPSIPRTQSQVTLHFVSIVMCIIGAVVLLGAALVFVYRDSLGLDDESLWTVFAYGGILAASAALLVVTGVLGLRAADDAERVEPYRFLCYLVGLVLLVAIVWGWGMGTIILFNPIVIVSTLTYVVVCSGLADRVQEERDAGERGRTYLMDGRQRTLGLLSEVIVVKALLTLVVVAVALIALYAADDPSGVLATFGVEAELDDVSLAVVVVVGLALSFEISLGLLGMRGSREPDSLAPFVVLAGLVVVLDLVQIVGSVVSTGGFGAVSMDEVLDLLYMAACLRIAWTISHEPAPAEDSAEA